MVGCSDGWIAQPGDLLIYIQEADQSGVMCGGERGAEGDDDDETRGSPAFCFCLSSPWFSYTRLEELLVGTE